MDWGAATQSYRGLNNYLYYVGSSLLLVWYNLSQNPILIIKAPILDRTVAV